RTTGGRGSIRSRQPDGGGWQRSARNGSGCRTRSISCSRCRRDDGMSRDPMDDRLDEEVRFHIDMQTERNIRMGMTPDDARRQANLQFGGREKWKSEARDEYRGHWYVGLRNDFGFAARSLMKHRGFALTATLTLALGIGASTAIFSVVNAVLLRPLPYRDADRLVLIWGDMRARNVTDFPFAPGNYR